MSKKPLILISGDDSVRAKGVILIKRLIEDFADFKIIATKEQQSGAGTKISFSGGEWGKEIVDGTEAIWVDGSPRDAAFFAFDYLDREPDLVISGLNMGTNYDNSMHSSGTVGVAVSIAQARNKPAIALSLETAPDQWSLAHDGSFDESLLEYPGKQIRKIINAALKSDFPRSTFWNVNFPKDATDEIIVAKTEPKTFWKNNQKISKNKFEYINSLEKEGTPDKDSDAHFLAEGKIVVTPCKLEYTNFDELKKMQDAKLFA